MAPDLSWTVRKSCSISLARPRPGSSWQLFQTFSVLFSSLIHLLFPAVLADSLVFCFTAEVKTVGWELLLLGEDVCTAVNRAVLRFESGSISLAGWVIIGASYLTSVCLSFLLLTWGSRVGSCIPSMPATQASRVGIYCCLINYSQISWLKTVNIYYVTVSVAQSFRSSLVGGFKGLGSLTGLASYEVLAGPEQLPLGWSLTWYCLGLFADAWMLWLAFP